MISEGSGYTLWNVDIDPHNGSVGVVFGSTYTADIQNLTIDPFHIYTQIISAAVF